jgi:hypothetical protein
MKLFGMLFGKHRLVDIMRLDIHMSFSPVLGGGQGIAFVNWTPLEYSEPNFGRVTKPTLLSLLYSRTLTNTETKETRTKLFELINELSISNIRDQGHTGFLFPEWTIDVFGTHLFIWPWIFAESPNDLDKPKLYSATLQAFPNIRDYYAIDLKIAWGQEKILTPASVLIAIYYYCQTIDNQECYELALLLWQINEYYRLLGNISIGHESKAFKFAMDAIRNGNLTIP